MDNAHKPTKSQKGRMAEAVAESFLTAKGLRIVAKNITSRHGEIDLIAREGSTLIFVEVRSVSSPTPLHPLETISRHKQRHLIRSALSYLQHHGLADLAVRFDVIGIIWQSGQDPEITWIQHAFDARECE